MNPADKALVLLQFGQIASDAWKSPNVNDAQKLFNICVLLPSGGAAFAGIHPSDGSDSITASYIKNYLLKFGKEVSPMQSRDGGGEGGGGGFK
jgi:hypothetical protein